MMRQEPSGHKLFQHVPTLPVAFLLRPSGPPSAAAEQTPAEIPQILDFDGPL